MDSQHHLSHSTTSLASGRRVHTIPIRVEGRSRPSSCPPTTVARQRVYEIPVNVLSTPSDEQPAKPLSPPVKLSDKDEAERKLASLMSQLETEMSSSSAAGKQISLTPVSVSATKSPPPYHGPHITEFFRRPANLPAEGMMSLTKPATGVVVAEAGSSAGTPARTVAVGAKTAVSVERYGELYSTLHFFLFFRSISEWFKLN